MPVWGVSVTGEVVYRHGVTPSRPEGEKWSLIPAECPMCYVCATVDSCGMWAISKDGRAHLRIGINKKNPQVVYLFIYFLCIFLFYFIFLSTYLSVYPSVYVSVSINLSIYQPIYIPPYPKNSQEPSRNSSWLYCLFIFILSL